MVVAYFLFSTAVTGLPGTVRKVCDTHDRFAHRSKLTAGHPAPRPYRWFSLTPRQEQRVLSRFASVLAIQEEEAEQFRRNLPLTTSVYTVDLLAPAVRLNRHSPSPFTFGFLGSNNPPNLHGLNWFFTNIWPPLRQTHPHARLLVAGNCPIPVDIPGVTHLGPLPDLTPFFREISCLINPVHQGTGLQMKSLEALRHGIPLITTPTGSRGLARKLATGITIAPTGDAFLEACRTPAVSEPTRLREAYENARSASLAQLREAIG